jgi:hypothetical protein
VRTLGLDDGELGANLFDNAAALLAATAWLTR